mmetsp:Transcript_39146/g.98408  ORF Transcript_39146/g.98408 Transcript_39146/m.98408 type:complete len:202 (-) Transcript_39146:1349-1954(-)
MAHARSLGASSSESDSLPPAGLGEHLDFVITGGRSCFRVFRARVAFCSTCTCRSRIAVCEETCVESHHAASSSERKRVEKSSNLCPPHNSPSRGRISTQPDLASASCWLCAFSHCGWLRGAMPSLQHHLRTMLRTWIARTNAINPTATVMQGKAGAMYSQRISIVSVILDSGPSNNPLLKRGCMQCWRKRLELPTNPKNSG